MKVRWWFFAVGHGGRLQREAEDGWQVSQTSKADKGPFYTKDPLFFSFFLLNLQIRGFIRASLLAFVHFCVRFLTPED